MVGDINSESGLGVGLLERRITELENLLTLRKQSTKDHAINLARLLCSNCPVPTGIVGRKRGEGRDAKDFTTILYTNEAFHEYFGYKQENIVGSPYYNFIEGDHKKTIRELSGIPTDKPKPIRVIKKNGDIVNCQLVKDDLYVPFCGRQLFVLSWFYLYPIEEE